jgi:mercuric ion transport protein
MPTLVDRARRVLPSGLTGLAGVACAACCAIPLLLAAGVLSGAGWAAAGAWMPGIAVALAALAGGAWWWTARRRHRGGCAGGTSCGCSTGSPA